MKSTFTYSINKDFQIIFIEDSNIGMSVTNDIENVIESIARDFKKENNSISHYDIIYRDSNGIIDGIYITDEKFHDFYSIGETDYNKAILKIDHTSY